MGARARLAAALLASALLVALTVSPSSARPERTTARNPGVHAAVFCNRHVFVVAALYRSFDNPGPRSCWTWHRPIDGTRVGGACRARGWDWAFDDYPNRTTGRAVQPIRNCRAAYPWSYGFVYMSWQRTGFIQPPSLGFNPTRYLAELYPSGTGAVYDRTAYNQWWPYRNSWSPMISLSGNTTTLAQLTTVVQWFCERSNGVIGLYINSRSFSQYAKWPSNRRAAVLRGLDNCARPIA